MDYFRRLVTLLWKNAAPWARDNIVLAAVMVILPPVVVIFRDRKHEIDWSIIRTSGSLYLLVFACYLLFQVIRTIERLDSQHMLEIRNFKTILASQIVISPLEHDDPIIEACFIDLREQTPRAACLRLTNRGVRDAKMIRIHPLRLIKRTVTFPETDESLKTNESSSFMPEVGEQWGYDSHHDLIRAMSEEWVSHENYKTVRECLVPARIDFEDEDGTRFEASFELLYFGGQGLSNPEKRKCIECRNFKYRRIPLGVTER